MAIDQNAYADNLKAYVDPCGRQMTGGVGTQSMRLPTTKSSSLFGLYDDAYSAVTYGAQIS